MNMVPPFIDGATLTVVCAWCTPKAELDAINRQRPITVSHGICAACVVIFEAGEHA